MINLYLKHFLPYDYPLGYILRINKNAFKKDI